MRSTTTFAVAFALCAALPWLACATGPGFEPEPMPASVNDVGPCETDTSLAATRVAVPEGLPACGTADRAAAATACDAADVVACYVATFCETGTWLKADESDARTAALDASQARLRDACDKGVAEACLLRAGVAIENGTPAKETCADVVRACQLGDEANACLSCVATDC
jgi:hypothetical protein